MKRYCLLILLPFILFSCKKGSSPTKTPPKPITGNTDKVTRTITLDSGYSATKYVYEEYRYNDSGRVTRYIKYEVDSSTMPVHKDTVQVIAFDYILSDTSRMPGYGLQNYRTSLYRLSNAIHRYFYDTRGRLVLDTLIDFYRYNSNPPPTDRGVVVSRRMRYNASSVIVANINLDTQTSLKGSYRDSIVLDGNGDPLFVSTLNGSNYVTGNMDNYQQAGFVLSNYTYSAAVAPLSKMNVSQLMAFMQTGFPGGAFYTSYLAKNACSSSSDQVPGIANPIITHFQYITDPSNKTLLRKILFSRSGTGLHGGYKTFVYNTPF